MSNNFQFDSKWKQAREKHTSEEFCIFVPKGGVPQTQRQFNLFHYFEYIGEKARQYNCKNALEVGCGRGTISLYLNKYLGMDVTLVDLSEEGVDLAKKNFEFCKAEGTIKQDNAEALSFVDNSFDMVFSIGLAEHFEDYTKVFSEQYRVLKPGGIMISLNIPKKKSIQELNKLYRFFLRIGGTRRQLKNDYFRNTDKPEDFKRKALEVGFENVSTFYVNSFPLFTPFGKGAEKIITKFYGIVYKLRALFMDYPFKGSVLLSQAHFLFAIKPFAA